MSLIQAVLLAVLQGASELFPVSSLGHAVTLPALLHWHIDENGPVFLPFLVMLHVGTATALLAYFWRDWLALGLGVIGLADPVRVRESRRVMLLIIVATLPAVVVGGVAEHMLRHLFGAPSVVALFLAANGILLAVCERLRAKTAERELSQLRMSDALIIGCWQCLALIPGLSRSGATICGGLLRGVDHEASAHFSFLIATPDHPGGDGAGSAETAARQRPAADVAGLADLRRGGGRGSLAQHRVPDALVQERPRRPRSVCHLLRCSRSGRVRYSAYGGLGRVRRRGLRPSTPLGHSPRPRSLERAPTNGVWGYAPAGSRGGAPAFFTR